SCAVCGAKDTIHEPTLVSTVLNPAVDLDVAECLHWREGIKITSGYRRHGRAQHLKVRQWKAGGRIKPALDARMLSNKRPRSVDSYRKVRGIDSKVRQITTCSISDWDAPHSSHQTPHVGPKRAIVRFYTASCNAAEKNNNED